MSQLYAYEKEKWDFLDDNAANFYFKCEEWPGEMMLTQKFDSI